jgi:hypothetical protein
VEQRDASQTPESQPAPAQPVETKATGSQHADARPDDPQASEPRPRSWLERMKLYAFRTTLGRTRREKADV